MRLRMERRTTLHLGYTALVDILLATLGIFVVVFALQTMKSDNPLVPAIADGLVICTATDDTPEALLLATREGSEIELRVPIDTRFSDVMRDTWPDGGRIWVAMSKDCAFGDAIEQLRAVESDLRILGEASAPYILTLAPLALDDIDDLIFRWRSDR